MLNIKSRPKPQPTPELTWPQLRAAVRGRVREVMLEMAQAARANPSSIPPIDGSNEQLAAAILDYIDPDHEAHELLRFGALAQITYELQRLDIRSV